MEELITRCSCGNPFLEVLRGQELRIRSVEVN
jgi:Zn finger protein HypA/HybF involved in hydrogenase expression